MKRFKRVLVIILLILLMIIPAHIYYLYSLTPDEVYPEDTYLSNVETKRALIIVAHDDEAALFAGTTTLLARQGWEISFLTFYNNIWRPEEVPIRKKEMQQVAGILGFRHTGIIDFTLRNSLDTVSQPWIPIPYDQFDRSFGMDSLRMYVKEAILQARPTVIFTLDNVIGGYGHPEHVVVSQVALDVSKELHASREFSVERIYQNVWPESQSVNIMGEGGPYAMGKEVYECDGMPEPDVQVDISSAGSGKMSVISAHASQHRNLKKFVPYYNYYPGWLYFGIFDKEHFRVLKIND